MLLENLDHRVQLELPVKTVRPARTDRWELLAYPDHRAWQEVQDPGVKKVQLVNSVSKVPRERLDLLVLMVGSALLDCLVFLAVWVLKVHVVTKEIEEIPDLKERKENPVYSDQWVQRVKLVHLDRLDWPQQFLGRKERREKLDQREKVARMVNRDQLDQPVYQENLVTPDLLEKKESQDLLVRQVRPARMDFRAKMELMEDPVLLVLEDLKDQWEPLGKLVNLVHLVQLALLVQLDHLVKPVKLEKMELMVHQDRREDQVHREIEDPRDPRVRKVIGVFLGMLDFQALEETLVLLALPEKMVLLDLRVLVDLPVFLVLVVPLEQLDKPVLRDLRVFKASPVPQVVPVLEVPLVHQALTVLREVVVLMEKKDPMDRPACPEMLDPRGPAVQEAIKVIPDHQERLDHQVQLVRLDQMVTEAQPVMLDRREMWALKEPQDGMAKMALPVPTAGPANRVYLATKDGLDRLENRVQLDSKVKGDLLVSPATVDPKDRPENVDPPVQWVPQDLKDSLETQDRLDRLDRLVVTDLEALPVLLEIPVHLVLQALRLLVVVSS